jgi:integron integrase
MTREETVNVINALAGVHQLMVKLLYGSGLRLMECVRLRVKDVDLDRRQILVREGKGNKDRITMLPETATAALKDHLLHVKQVFENDLKEGYGQVYLPNALERKYPNANRQWIWQYVFPAKRLSVDPRGRLKRRHHIHENSLQKAVKKAAALAGISKSIGCHTFRHSFATHLLEDGYDIRTVQELLGHKSLKATMIYTHVLNKGVKAVRSPLDG